MLFLNYFCTHNDGQFFFPIFFCQYHFFPSLNQSSKLSCLHGGTLLYLHYSIRSYSLITSFCIHNSSFVVYSFVFHVQSFVFHSVPSPYVLLNHFSYLCSHHLLYHSVLPLHPLFCLCVQSILHLCLPLNHFCFPPYIHPLFCLYTRLYLHSSFDQSLFHILPPYIHTLFCLHALLYLHFSCVQSIYLYLSKCVKL